MFIEFIKELHVLFIDTNYNKVMIESTKYLRFANLGDVENIVKLITPLEKTGVLIHREKSIIKRDIVYFSVIERNNSIVFGCAALIPFSKKIGELSCFAIDPEFQNLGFGTMLLKYIERRAKLAGIQSVFVLTTATELWFLKHNFLPANIKNLPKNKQKMYDWKRKSIILIKKLR